MNTAVIGLYVCNGVIQTLWLTNQRIRQDDNILRFVPAILFIYIGVTLLAVCTDNQVSVNRSTEETICASGRLASYLYPSCSAGRINLYAKVGVYYTYNNSNKILDG